MALLTATLTAPMATVTSSAGALPSASIVVTAPAARLFARLGAHIDVSAPMAAIVASGTVRTPARAALTAPLAQVTARASFGRALHADLTAPMATAIVRGGSQIIVSAPMATAEAVARVGRSLSAIVTAPMAVLEAAAAGHAGLRVDLVAPMGRLLPSVTASVTAPLGRVAARVALDQSAVFEAYAINLHTVQRVDPRAERRDYTGEEVTRYTNYPFTQIVRFGAQYYGVGADGLYLLEGATDDGTPITWGIRTETTDFDSTAKKNPASCYVGGRLGPDSLFTVYVGEKSEKSYTYRTPRGETAQNYRRTFGRGLDARYFAFEIEGDGELSIDDLKFEIIQRTRSV